MLYKWRSDSDIESVCIFACVGYEPCLPSDQVVHVTKETLPLVVQSLNPVLRLANKASSCKHRLSGSQKHNKTQECCSHTDVLHISYLIMSTSFIPFSSFLVLIIILWHSSTFLTQHFTHNTKEHLYWRFAHINSDKSRPHITKFEHSVCTSRRDG
jgi:hypothetical protein